MSALRQEDKLLRMANQIATFFRSYPEEEAVAGIHKHIVAFWTPKMVSKLEAALPEMGDRADILVQRALRGGEPQAESPIRAATRDPQKLGEGASDAG
ncbi:MULTISPECIES: formate dehydrogenase subunit delta [unclassified Methylobacterium]|jgi:formate dehydrogenase subunit delta|uniref:formate dehydrogenase subunit delta n=1 Tax=unclassified Methylobacterium TaxID=2615210 RepID=UPI001FB896E0|nr:MULTISPECIES: formate dehydrogenase subunit delta [unclassified Methylobacterium]MCJ2020335.1 formate dehydrogenase subunit delta [Methylobacterium sp. E-065]